MNWPDVNYTFMAEFLIVIGLAVEPVIRFYKAKTQSLALRIVFSSFFTRSPRLKPIAQMEAVSGDILKPPWAALGLQEKPSKFGDLVYQ